MFQLGTLIRALRVANAAAAGVTTVNSSTVDVAGAESVLFIVHFGAIVAGAVTSVKAQQGALADGTDAADLEGTGIVVPDTADNKIVLLEVIQPRERYLRAVVSRATQNATVDSITALLFSNRKVPTPAQDASVLAYLYKLSPAEGAA